MSEPQLHNDLANAEMRIIELEREITILETTNLRYLSKLNEKDKPFGFVSWEDYYKYISSIVVDNMKLREVLKKLLFKTNTIEVLGEWEALDINTSLRKKNRAEVDAIIAEARALVNEGSNSQKNNRDGKSGEPIRSDG